MRSWWCGPDFLQGDESGWPKNTKFQGDNFVDQLPEFEEVQSVSTTLVQDEKSTIGELIDCKNYSDYEKLVRVTCYVVRFVKSVRKMKERRPSSLELDEIELSEAEISWTKDAQRYFRAEPNFKQRKSQGDIVVVHEDKIPRQLWKVGRVEDLMRGRDGNVRAATIRTSSGGQVQQLQRPIQRLYPIEISTKNPGTVPQIKFVRDYVPNAIQDFNT
ncbi:Hypothetical predicted protein [Paramuricea clavata]|uniref:DUF5641 domain-containing protein n=1 Tax=Paramuricea clavata TaxID=317549 RepID=A0A6S7HBC8_PARCT|nr:Hypothetical predicted protein [Paramuricea clavata]